MRRRASWCVSVGLVIAAALLAAHIPAVGGTASPPAGGRARQRELLESGGVLAALPTWVVQIGMGLADPALLQGSDPAEGPLVRIDSVDNVIVAARVWAGADSNVVVAKLSPAGAALWQVEVPGFGDSEDQLGALELAADGGPVVAGLAAGSVFAAAYSPAGTPRWTRRCSTDAGTGGSLGLQVLSGGGAILH